MVDSMGQAVFKGKKRGTKNKPKGKAKEAY
jgi:hypothetical protein